MLITEEDFSNLFLQIRKYGKYLLNEDVVEKDTPHRGIIGSNCKYIYDENLKTEIYAFRDPIDSKFETICFNHKSAFVSLSKHDIGNGHYVSPIFEHLFINAKNLNKNTIMVIRS